MLSCRKQASDKRSHKREIKIRQWTKTKNFQRKKFRFKGLLDHPNCVNFILAQREIPIHYSELETVNKTKWNHSKLCSYLILYFGLVIQALNIFPRRLQSVTLNWTKVFIFWYYSCIVFFVCLRKKESANFNNFVQNVIKKKKTTDETCEWVFISIFYDCSTAAIDIEQKNPIQS